nr:Gag-Pol polymerase [Tanacetum cinerariifolium]
TRKRCKWDNDEYICRGNILNGMSDALFDVYQNVESVKELWDQLEAKYMAEDTSSKKFLVSNFNNYKMVNSSHVSIKETLRMEESRKGKGKDIGGSSSVNMVEDDKNKKNSKNSKGNKRKFHEKKNDSNKKSKMDDEIAWWIDSGATCQACKDRCWFNTFHLVKDGSVVYMGD